MILEEQIRRSTAAAFLGVARSGKATASFSHRGATAVTLFVIAGPEAERVEEGGNTTEARSVTLDIPTGQAGFTAGTSDVNEPVTPGDTLVYRGKEYSVQSEIKKSGYGAVYTVPCLEHKRLAANTGR
jgi:hypothetical protein